MVGRRVPLGIVSSLVVGTRWVGVAGGMLLGFLPAAAAQRANPGPAYATRAMLEQQLREGSGDAAHLIRARLDSGDFRPGDRVLIIVEGEKELSDTFTVGMMNDLSLPQIGVIPLMGVLRTELPDRLTYALARYIRAPVVSVQPLIRVAIEGDVTHPGFYALAPEMPIMDALTAAGGLTRNALLGKARVERAGVTVLHGFTLENAVRSGSNFDALNLRAGDRLYIPGKRDWYTTVQTVAILLTIPITIYTITVIW